MLVYCLLLSNNMAFSQKEISFFGKIGIPIQCDKLWINNFDWKKPNLGIDVGAIYHMNKFFFAGIGTGYHITNLNVYSYDYENNTFGHSHSFFDIYTKIGFQINVKERVFFRIGTNQGYGLNRFKFPSESDRRYFYDYWIENTHCFLFAPEFQILVRISENLFLDAGTDYKMYLTRHDGIFFFTVQLGMSYNMKIHKLNK